MATNTDILRSEGGFGVNTKTIISKDYDLQNVNSFELKNSNFTNASKVNYILRKTTTAVSPSSILSLTAGTSFILLPLGSVNFVTAHIVGTNANGSGFYSIKKESTVTVDAAGDVASVGELNTIIKDSIPSGENWTIGTYDAGSSRQFSYTVNQGTAAGTILWIAHVEVVSADW